jgi:hypothetical protein
MALKPCQGCGKQVDTTAKTCPGCGRPNPASSGALRLFGGFFVATLVLGTAAKLCSSDGAQTATAPQVSKYKTVALQSLAGDGYKGMDICTCGFVQSTTSGDRNTVYVAASRDWRKDNKVVEIAVCWWDNYGPHGNFSRPVDSQVCVRGTYHPPEINPCSVVDNCPW